MKYRYSLCLCMLALPVCVQAADVNVAVLLAETGVAPGVSSPRATFNDSDYRLGYEVYLKHGDLAAAFQVAGKALEARPNDKAWLRSFAQVAEWTAQPAEALRAWLKLARLTGSREAWDSVGRLAPGLLDEEALLAYQEHALLLAPDDEKLVKGIAATYERMGRVEEGLAFLAGLEASHTSEMLLETEATLAERSGRDELALSLLKRLNRTWGPSEKRLLRITAISYLNGHQVEAWRELDAAAARMPGSAVGFWQSYAHLSGQLGYRKEAKRAFQVLVESGKANASDLMEYVSLLQNEDGLAAARFSETLFRAFGNESAMVTALYLYQRERHPQAALALLATPTPEQLAKLEKNPDFLEQRGQIAWQQRDPVAAREDFSRALKMRPGNPQLLLDLVSLATDQADTAALHGLLPAYSQHAHLYPVLWLAWANGWNQLNQPMRALPYLKSHCRRNPGDRAAMLALADTYERTGDIASAQKLRQRVMRSLAGSAGPVLTPESAVGLRNTLLGLRLAHMTPDAGQVLLRPYLKLDANGKPDTATRELVLSWFLAQGSEEKAKAWMNFSYKGDAPAWAQTRLAEFVEKDGSASARDAAFDAYERNPESDDAAQRFRDTVDSRFSALELQADTLDFGSFDRTVGGLAWLAPVGSGVRLRGEVQHIAQTFLGIDESGDRERISASYETRRSLSGLSLGRTRLLTTYASLDLHQQFILVSGRRVELDGGWNVDAPESEALLALGVKDYLSAGFHFPVAGGWFVGGRLQGDLFYGKDRESLGGGSNLSLNGGLKFPFLAIANTLEITASAADFDAENSPLSTRLQSYVPPGTTTGAGFFIPADFTQADIRWRIGDTSLDAYTSRWRGFGELSANYSDVGGSGYGVGLGLHGPVLSHDNLKLRLARGESAQGGGSTLTQASLAYQYFY